MEPALLGARKKRILVFCRMVLIDDFRENLREVESEYDFRYLTDGRARGTHDTRRRFYAALAAGERCAEITSDDEADIIARCRLSRNLDPQRASNQVHAMAIALRETIDDFGPDAVLSQMVDDYATHTLAVLAAKQGLTCACYSHSYFPGRTQLTVGANGHPLRVRTADEHETTEIHDRINQRAYRQNYLQVTDYHLRRHLYLLAKHYLRYLVFGAKSIIERDPRNVHYTIIPFMADRSTLSNFPRRTYFAEDWRAEYQRLNERRPDARTIYLPLAYAPESTIDYWIADRSAIDYEAMTLASLKVLTRDATVLVKEHIHMQGIRSRQFYRAMQAIDGVVLVPPDQFSNDVLELSDAVLVGAGSVGIEATIRGKPVVTYSSDSYWFEGSGAHYAPLDQIAAWPEIVDRAISANVPLTPNLNLAFVAQCLESTARLRSGQKSVWPLIRTDDLRAILDAI